MFFISLIFYPPFLAPYTRARFQSQHSNTDYALNYPCLTHLKHPSSAAVSDTKSRHLHPWGCTQCIFHPCSPWNPVSHSAPTSYNNSRSLIPL